MQVCVKVYTTTCKTVVSVFVVTINALKGYYAPLLACLVWEFDGKQFSSGEARRYLIASILEENKHRGNATCANNYNACPKRVLQQSFFAKSLVGTTEGQSAAICGEETQAKILLITSA